MESGGLRFDSSWELRIFSLSYARDKTKNIFLNFFTELKTYYLSYSFYKGLIIPLLFSVFSNLILVCDLHPTALSVHRKRCTPKKKTTRTKPFKCYLCSLLLKNSLLQKSNLKNEKKINVWIVQCGQDVDTHFCCSTMVHFAALITLCGEMTQ